MKSKREFLLIFLIILALTITLLSACNKKQADSTVADTTSRGTELSTTAAVFTTAAVTTAPTTAPMTKEPEETFVSPDLSLVDFDKTLDESVFVYNNPLIPEVRIINPFVFRYDGVYYLMGSARRDADLFIYKSTDLVNWSDGIMCLAATDRVFLVDEYGDEGWAACYAPEVTYFNGQFILVTSLGAMGHCFFVSDSPEGPYKKVDDELWGCKIDGSIFIDNDGKWYFYSANSRGGIHVFDMTEPTKVDVSTERSAGAVMDDGAGTWTEGPMVVYHDGTYYLTYTGNHVEHAAYRIDYGISHDSPTSFTEGKGNPVLVSTSDAAVGIGHSSTVKGPDLDSYYIAYHTRNGLMRHNIDRIVFNGDVMTVLGPTVAQAAVPNMPDIYSLFDSADDASKLDGTFTIGGGNLSLGAGARVLFKDTLGRDEYTLEITTKNIAKSAKAGAVFGYKDENNYGSAMFDTKTEELVITFTVGGKKTEYREKLVRSFDIAYDFNAVQSIQIEKTGNVFTFFVNDRELCKKESTLDGGRIGAITEGGAAEFGFIGATAATGGNSTKDHYKPVATQTGYILSTHCREWDINTGVREDTKEEYLKAFEGETYNYSVYAEKLGKYSLATCYKSEKGAVLSVFVDGTYIRDIKLSPSADIATEVIRDIDIGYKGHVITIYVREGEADIFYYRCLFTADKAVNESFEREEKSVSYSDGIGWKIKDGALTVSGISKRLYGTSTMGDYKLSFTARANATNFVFGALVRVTSPSDATKTALDGTRPDTEEGAAQGANWMQGYYIELLDSTNTVTVYKCSYGKKKLSSASYDMKYRKDYEVEIVCKGADITVFINGEEILTCTDPEPYITGMAGFKNSTTSAGGVSFDDLKILPIK